MNPPPLGIDHVCRISVLETEKTWSLRGDTLWVGSGDYPPLPVPLASLAKVRLVFSPTRVQRNRYQCHLFNANGKCGAFQNEHYKGVLDFEDRSGSYRELTTALVKRTAAVNPQCEFVTGTSWWSWLLQTGFLAAMLLLLAAVFFFMGSATTWSVVVKLLIIAFFIPTAWSWIAKNKPRRFSPETVPEKLLPSL